MPVENFQCTSSSSSSDSFSFILNRSNKFYVESYSYNITPVVILVRDTFKETDTNI